MLLVAVERLSAADIPELGVRLHHDLVTGERQQGVVAGNGLGDPGDGLHVGNIDRRQKRGQPVRLVKGARPGRNLEDENRPPMLASRLAFQSEGRVLHMCKHDVVDRTGQRHVPSQGNAGVPSAADVCVGRIRGRRFRGGRFGAEGGRRRQHHQERRHSLEQRPQAIHEQWAFFLSANWSAQSRSERSLIIRPRPRNYTGGKKQPSNYVTGADDLSRCGPRPSVQRLGRRPGRDFLTPVSGRR